MSKQHLKHAVPDHPILDVIAERWSPYAFEPRGVEPEKLRACLEAARWAASSFNEQPWSFIVATRDDEAEFARMVGCLMEANRDWAKNAGALLLTVVSTTFSRNGKPNRVAQHDLGLAVGNLSAQATALGLEVHQMAGIEIGKIRHGYQIPESHDPVTAIAIGYAADPSSLEEPWAERDKAPRSRKTLSEFVFQGAWSRAADL
jgi:nitroreductase